MSTDSLGEALSQFSAALSRFRAALSADAGLSDAVFHGAEVWTDLLLYKLLPQLGGEGCLVAAVAGGTNTGKSTVFNLLLGGNTSPVRSTAAATCRPLLAANARRGRECLEGRLLNEFAPRPLDNPESIVRGESPPETLFVATVEGLPDRLVLLDTPDVDSIDKANWVVADHIRAAGDVLVAVVTGEKYRDDRVVEFFRRAHAAGRVILPLMNKANPENDFEIARAQLREFCADVGLNAPPLFAVPHDFALARDFRRPIVSLNGGAPLLEHLSGLDVTAIKQRVYRDTVRCFATETGRFMEQIGEIRTGLRRVVDDFEARAGRYATKYDPAPGAAVGGLFHEFVQSKRTGLDRVIGNASRTFVSGVSAVGRAVGGALFRRSALESPDPVEKKTAIHRAHEQALERHARELATSYYDSARTLGEPAGHLVAGALDALDIEAAIPRIVGQTLKAESISDAFREHAERMLNTWWNDHAGKRRVIEALDKLLVIAPTAIAGAIALQTGGVGAPEAIWLATPVVEQFAARVIEYQFGDAMFDFISPWRAEQQEAFRQALLEHMTRPALERLDAMLAVLEGEAAAELRKWQELCRPV